MTLIEIHLVYFFKYQFKLITNSMRRKLQVQRCHATTFSVFEFSPSVAIRLDGVWDQDWALSVLSLVLPCAVIIFGRVRFSGGCFLRSPRRLRLRRCHSQEGSKENKLSETFYTKLCKPPRGSRRSPPSWLLSCARAPQSLGRGPDKRWPIRSLHFNYRPIRTHHQPVGEVGPHDGPAVASLVGVILLDVVRILICCVQDNNLIIEWLV